MKDMNPKVDNAIQRAGRWQQEFKELRRITRSCDLTEELKWGQPCYARGGKNIVLIHGFKEYCALLFFKGALLKDPAGILIQQTENTQAARQIRFSDLDEIIELEPVITAYIQEAIAVEEAGLKVDLKPTSEYPVPAEFQASLEEDPALKAAFDALTPGRQRAYLMYFAQAKQAKTRESRIEKYREQILAGKGLYD